MGRRLAVVGSDSILMLDADLKRVTVLHAGEVVATVPVSVGAAAEAELLDGRVIVNGSSDGPRGGTSVHVIGMQGVEHSFDSYPAWDGESTPLDHLRVLAVASDRTLWVADRFEYVVRRWTLRGDLVDSIRRSAAWFTGRSTHDWGIQSPGPFVQDVREDSDARLWVAIWRPSDAWMDAWRRLPQSRIVDGEVTLRDRPATLELFATMIEVLDPSTGAPVVSERWPGLVLAFLSDDRLAALSEDYLGVPYVDVWSVRIVGN